MRILLVDDEADLVDAIARGLRRNGYAVDMALNGEEALAKASWIPYDLICLDITMPGMDDVLEADELFLTNSSWQVLPVTGLLLRVREGEDADGDDVSLQHNPVGDGSVGAPAR